MVKNKIKKIAAMLMAATVMVGTLGSGTAFAASSKSGKLRGITCNGRVEFVYTPAGTANGVSAITTFGAGGTLTAKATVYYKKNGKRFTRTSSDCSAGGGVSAIAYTNDDGNVYGGKGIHKVVFGAYTWAPSATQIGTTW